MPMLCVSAARRSQNGSTGVGIKMDRAVFLQWESKGLKGEKHDIGSLDLVPLLHIFGHSGFHLCVVLESLLRVRPPLSASRPCVKPGPRAVLTRPSQNVQGCACWTLSRLCLMDILKAALLSCRRSVVADGCIRGLVMNH